MREWVAITAIVSVVLIALLDKINSKTVVVLHEWQTFVTGMIAIGVAVLTVWVIHRQGKAQREYEARLLERRTWVAKAKLLNTLNSLSEYSMDVISALHDSSKDFPKPPNDDIERIEDAIEHVDAGVARQLSDLVIFYQIHNARLGAHREERKPRPTSGPSWEQRVMDAVTLNVRTTELFDYARAGREYRQLTIEKFHSVLGWIKRDDPADFEERYSWAIKLLEARAARKANS